MKDRVPNQVRVQNGPHVVARSFFGYPSLDPQTVQLNGFISVGLLPSPVLIKEVSYIFDYLIPNLHAHALFGNGTQQGFKHQLSAITAFVTRKVRGQALQLVTGNECSICADDNVVQVIAYRQLLTQGRFVELLFVLGDRDWHRYSSLKYADLISRSLDTAQYARGLAYQSARSRT